MTVTLELPAKLEAALQTQAQSHGVSMEQYLLMLAERDTADVPSPPPGSEHWILQDALDYAGPLPDDLGSACAIPMSKSCSV
jgi:hypothetical protein